MIDCILLAILWYFFGAEIALVVHIGGVVGFWTGEHARGK
jgi:UPF0716 family protein affecting phage T7 exclusion